MPEFVGKNFLVGSGVEDQGMSERKKQVLRKAAGLAVAGPAQRRSQAPLSCPRDTPCDMPKQ